VEGADSPAKPERILKPPGAALDQGAEQPAGRHARRLAPTRRVEQGADRALAASLRILPAQISTREPAEGSKSPIRELSSTPHPRNLVRRNRTANLRAGMGLIRLQCLPAGRNAGGLAFGRARWSSGNHAPIFSSLPDHPFPPEIKVLLFGHNACYCDASKYIWRGPHLVAEMNRNGEYERSVSANRKSD
jgi:hypothetical protein